MQTSSDVTVKLDDRIRLVSALVAVTDWPEKSQARRPHGTHAHARATRKRLAAFQTHEAVQMLQWFLDSGAPIEAVFDVAARLSWPDLQPIGLPPWVPARWPAALRDFYHAADVESWWRQEDAVWQKSLSEASRMFASVQFKAFLKPFLGDIAEMLVLMPNIGEPSDLEIGVRSGNDLVAIIPPRLAWGDSPPWPYDEDPVHIYRAALSQYCHLLLREYLRRHAGQTAEAARTPLPVSDTDLAAYPTWDDQFIHLFSFGAVAIFLEDCVSRAEANAYVLMERKARGVSLLPGVVSVLRRYLADRQTGRYNGLEEFLTLFPKQLRVARRFVTL